MIGPLGFHHSRGTELASHVYLWLVVNEFLVLNDSLKERGGNSEVLIVQLGVNKQSAWAIF